MSTAAVSSASFLTSSTITRTAISSSLHGHDDKAGGETDTYPDVLNRPIHDMQGDSDVGMHAIDDDDVDCDGDDDEDVGGKVGGGDETVGLSMGRGMPQGVS